MISRSQKNVIFTEAQHQVQACGGIILVHYSGLDVLALTDFRVKLREVQAQFKVIKNRVFKKALEAENFEEYASLLQFFKGPVGVVFLGEDLGAGVKAVAQFADDHEKLVVQTGFFDQSLVSPQDIKLIADLPAMDVLRAQILSTIVGVHRQVLGVLSAVSRDLVGVLAAIEKTKK